jgi:hypothetical protein
MNAHGKSLGLQLRNLRIMRLNYSAEAAPKYLDNYPQLQKVKAE